MTSAVDVNADDHAEVTVQQQSTGAIVYAAQGPGGFDHWGPVTVGLNANWHAV